MRRINKKGFTLPELLAAVVIIGILSTIAIVSVNNVMKKSHEEYDKKQNKLFTTAAQTYFTDNRSELPKKLLTEKEITLEKLIKENYIEEIVDYKKELYDQKESKAYVKKMGRGRYKYYSELVGSDGRIITDKEDQKKSSNISVNIDDNYDTEYTDMPEDLKDGNKTSIYYVNKILKMKVSGRASSDGISSWQYKIEKKTEQGGWKKYKSSGEIEVDDKEFNDIITINAKDFANGSYKLVVYAYGYDGEISPAAESKTIVIDKTKPKCEIEMSRKPDGLEVNPTDFGITDGKKYNWYKKGDLIAKMNITETNKYKYTIGLDEQTYNINYNEENKKTEEEYTIGHNVVGKYIYGYIQDKAGNVGKCNTEKPIYYDKTEPSCKISKVPDNPDGEHGWYISDVTLNLESDDNTDLNGESGVRDRELTMNNNFAFIIPVPTTYTNNISASQGETTHNGTTWYGYVRDKAGNERACEPETIKVDKTPPTCNTIVIGEKGKIDGNETGWYTSNVQIKGNCNDDAISGCYKNGNTTYEFSDEGEYNKEYEYPEEIKDYAGNKAINCSSVPVKIDRTKPTCSNPRVVEGTKGNYLWYRSNTKAWVDCSDNESGCFNGRKLTLTGVSHNVTDKTYTDHREVNADGTSNLSWKAIDNAGNESDPCLQTIYIDKIAPILTSSLKQDSNELTVNCSDETSGYASLSFDATESESTTLTEQEINGTKVSGQMVHSYVATGYKNSYFTCYDNAGNPAKIKGVKTSKDADDQTIYCRCKGTKNNKESVIWGCEKNVLNSTTDPNRSFNCYEPHTEFNGYTNIFTHCSTSC